MEEQGQVVDSGTESQEQEGQAATGQEQPQQGKPKAAIDQQIDDMIELQVNGKKQKLSRDEVIKRAQLADSATSRFNEASKMRQQAEKIMSAMKKDPIAALTDPSLGFSDAQVQELFEKWYVKKVIEPETLTEDQRKMKAQEEEIAEYKALKKQIEDQKENEKVSKLIDHWQNKVIETIETHKLPKTEFVAQRLLFYIKQNLDNEWNAPMDLIVEQVKEDSRAQYKEISENASAEELISLFGEGVVKKIHKHYLNQIRERRGIQAAEQNKEVDLNPKKERISMEEVNKRLRAMRTGRM